VARDYLLAKGAADDLRNIIRYTNERWGETRCLTYVRQLEDAAAAVARGEGIFKDLSVFHPGLRMVRCGRHCIFCLPRPGALPVILAILHERMDIMVRLKSRLE
jgi:toxin ParE1/3/4